MVSPLLLLLPHPLRRQTLLPPLDFSVESLRQRRRASNGAFFAAAGHMQPWFTATCSVKSSLAISVVNERGDRRGGETLSSIHPTMMLFFKGQTRGRGRILSAELNRHGPFVNRRENSPLYCTMDGILIAGPATTERVQIASLKTKTRKDHWKAPF